MVKAGKKTSSKSAALMRLALLAGILILANLVASFVFTRIDLTGDKRFTISENSKKLVGNLKDVVFVKVYLEGDFPPGFRKLRNSTEEMLDELRNYSNGNLEYEFIDPSANPDEKERNKLYGQLYRKGIQPTTIEEREKEGLSRQYIFPGAIVSYANQEVGVQLLKDQLGAPPEVMLNTSIQNLEFEICNAIRKVTSPKRPRIAFLHGQGELGKEQTADVEQTISASYDIEHVQINQQLGALDKYKLVIVAKPDSAFDEKDKFIIDQYVMHGGKVLWFIDQMQVSMDSLQGHGETMAMARDLKIDDMLFRYGVRVNYDLCQDLISSFIPVVTGYVGNQPKQQLMPWYYFPLMTPDSHHPAVTNLNAIKGQFISSIDTVGAEGVRKSVLLTTSQYSKLLPAPVRVSLGIMQFKPDPKMFPNSFVPMAVMLEGTFTSIFKNRLPAALTSDSSMKFKDTSVPTGMAVIADGDIIRNDIIKGSPAPLGYDKYTRTTYGNKAFVQNLVDYFCDDSGLMMLRNKEYRLRLLDPAIVEAKALPLKVINTVIPVVFVMLFGVFKFVMRRRRFR